MRILSCQTLLMVIVLLLLHGYLNLDLYQKTKNLKNKLFCIQFLLLSGDFGFLFVCLWFIETDKQSFFVLFILTKIGIELFVGLILFILIILKIIK